MKKILFIGLVVIAVLISGCYQPRVNLNTTVQQGGTTPTAPVETIQATPIPTPSPTPTPTPMPTSTPTPSAAATTSTATPSTTITTTSTATPSATVAVAVVQNFEFSPATITISKGQTVTWTNMDSAPHTITSTTGVFDSGTLNQGQTFSYTFNNTGTFEYSCTVHPSIPHGKVIVTG